MKVQHATDSRLDELLLQTTVIDNYRASFRDSIVLADSLFFDPQPGEPPIVTPLHQTFYQHFYCKLPDAPESAQDLAEIADPEGFLARLKIANKSRERVSSDWALHSEVLNGQPVVYSGEVVHIAEPADIEYKLDAEGNPNGWTSVIFRAERVATGVGFYFVYGETPVDAFDRTVVTRLYFNLGPAGVQKWIEVLTSSLNRSQVPFTLKCPLNPLAFRRTDSCVLYLPRRYFAFAWQILRPALNQVASLLRPCTPMFALPLVQGVSLADDPGNGESFGQHRMRLVARALCRECALNSNDLSAKRLAVVEEFSEAGLSLDVPHLNAGTTGPLPDSPETEL